LLHTSLNKSSPTVPGILGFHEERKVFSFIISLSEEYAAHLDELISL